MNVKLSTISALSKQCWEVDAKHANKKTQWECHQVNTDIMNVSLAVNEFTIFQQYSIEVPVLRTQPLGANRTTTSCEFHNNGSGGSTVTETLDYDNVPSPDLTNLTPQERMQTNSTGGQEATQKQSARNNMKQIGCQK